jgi:hypothetical protein
MTKRKWTKIDLRTMKSMAGKSKARVIARKLRRTEGAVFQKAFTIGGYAVARISCIEAIRIKSRQKPPRLLARHR